MGAATNWSELKRLAQVLTGPIRSDGELFRASEDLYQLMLQVSGLEPDSGSMQRDIRLPQGKALASVWAAHCILDYRRTRVFLRGLLGAIQAARLRFPGTQIHVLYAGCGPFASLALPLIPLLEEGTVAFTLLEINPQSFDYLQETVKNLGLSRWIRNMVLADATEYHVDPTQPVHVLLGEMMQAGLRQEPQVAAMLNLAPQLVTGGLMVPQCIKVQAGLLHPVRNQARMLSTELPVEPAYQLLEPAFELSVATVATQGHTVFSELEVNLPANRDPGFRQLALFTRIQVFGNECLDVWDSALTQPVHLSTLVPESPVRKIGLHYVPGDQPEFSWRVID